MAHTHARTQHACTQHTCTHARSTHAHSGFQEEQKQRISLLPEQEPANPYNVKLQRPAAKLAITDHLASLLGLSQQSNLPEKQCHQPYSLTEHLERVHTSTQLCAERGQHRPAVCDLSQIEGEWSSFRHTSSSHDPSTGPSVK